MSYCFSFQSIFTKYRNFSVSLLKLLLMWFLILHCHELKIIPAPNVVTKKLSSSRVSPVVPKRRWGFITSARIQAAPIVGLNEMFHFGCIDIPFSFFTFSLIKSHFNCPHFFTFKDNSVFCHLKRWNGIGVETLFMRDREGLNWIISFVHLWPFFLWLYISYLVRNWSPHGQ